MNILANVIAKITPNKDSFRKEIEDVVKTINKNLKQLKIKADAVIGGSFAKDTHLIGDHDCDIFVRFDQKYKDTNISDLLEKTIKQFKANRVHGSRDYFQFTKSLNYEIVPVLNITKPKEALNVTDVSPLHVAWVRKHKLSDQIRLSKAFCKANNIYGAESYIKGFSGHVLDIMTIYYGSFMKLMKASQKWKNKSVIDIRKYYKNAEEALFQLNTSKKQSPLIVIDPIQPDRNAAAALGNEAFAVFVTKAKEFLKKPSEKSFEKKEFDASKIDGIVVQAVPLEGKRDIVGAKLLKILEETTRQLEHHDFKVQKSGWNWNNSATFWFKLKEEKLPPDTVVQGPPVKFDKHADAFRKEHKNVFEKKGKLYAKTKREYTDAKTLIKDIIASEYVKSRVKRANLL